MTEIIATKTRYGEWTVHLVRNGNGPLLYFFWGGLTENELALAMSARGFKITRFRSEGDPL